MSMGYGPLTLLGSGFDKCFLPVDSILVADIKILCSNLNLVKSSHIVREKASFLACFIPLSPSIHIQILQTDLHAFP